jgi:hypothetical protein
MVVILAGYPKEMAELVATNPGFQSRFPKTIYFPDYSNDELVEILLLIAGKGTYDLTDKAKEAAEAWFAAHERGRGFGNGRLARNLFEAAVSRHAQRLVDVGDPSDEQLTTLESADIAAVPTEADREARQSGEHRLVHEPSNEAAPSGDIETPGDGGGPGDDTAA